jgi:hypothetical protein
MVVGRRGLKCVVRNPQGRNPGWKDMEDMAAAKQ